MPSDVIHLAIAEEQLKRNNRREENYEEFIKGVIYPDSVRDKSLTHYGECSSKSNLFKFVQENNMADSFKRGYFLHLLTDYLFYNHCIEYWSTDIYSDYSILDKELIQKYHVAPSTETINYVEFKQSDELKILSLPMVERFIDKVAELDIDNVTKEIQEKPEKWTKIRPLKEYKE